MISWLVMWLPPCSSACGLVSLAMARVYPLACTLSTR
nr:MAG TPA: Neurotransmitter-gated ion-channel transmembrane region [Ackermannviridae sp. ctjwt21]